MLKKLIIVAVILLVLIVAGVIGVVVYAGSLAKAGIERGGTYALGVPTKVNSVSLGVLSGKLGINGLDVGSPQGFAAPHFLALGDGNVEVGLASLNKSVIEVPKFSLDKLDVNLEKKEGKANYTVILDNVQKVTGGGDTSKPAPPKPAGGEEKKLIIKDLSLTNLTIHVNLLDIGGAPPITVPIKEIKLQNVGQTGSGVGGSGVTISELAGIIVQAIMQATVENGGGLIPADMLGDMKGQLAKLGDLSKMGMKAVGDATEKIEKAGEEAKKAVDDATKKIDDAKKGLEGLIPKKK